MARSIYLRSMRGRATCPLVRAHPERGFCGAMIGTAAGSTALGLAVGAAGAVAGTLAGAEARTWLAAALGSDRRAGLLEDAFAIGLAFFTLEAAS